MAELRSVHGTITLTGVAQVIDFGWSGRIRWASLQPGIANANPIYLGGEGVTSGNYGTWLPPSAANFPPPPHVIAEFDDGSLRLPDLYVLGTIGETLQVHALTYI